MSISSYSDFLSFCSLSIRMCQQVRMDVYRNNIEGLYMKYLYIQIAKDISVDTPFAVLQLQM